MRLKTERNINKKDHLYVVSARGCKEVTTAIILIDIGIREICTEGSPPLLTPRSG